MKDPIIELIDEEMQRLAKDANQQLYPYMSKVRWWMWRRRIRNDGINLARQVSRVKLQELRDAYLWWRTNEQNLPTKER